MTGPIRLLISASMATCLATGAVAQDEADFIAAFSGQWFAFDDQFGRDGQTCEVQLAAEAAEGEDRLPAASRNCTQPLSQVAGWTIADGKLVLVEEAGAPVARLGGSQQRVTGEIEASDRPVILERAQADQATRELASAIGRHRCVYVGLTQNCAEPDDLRKPTMTEEGGLYGSVEVVVNLNVRDQPRSTASIVGTLPEGTCLKVNHCTTASDGVWCRARFGDQNGWVRKTTLRQNEWPVLTYLNSCDDG